MGFLFTIFTIPPLRYPGTTIFIYLFDFEYFPNHRTHILLFFHFQLFNYA